jgi:cytochrome d ubiquinol oxidase subunit I
MELDLLTLSRLQFALTIMFHYIFPPLSIGLGALLVFMEGMYLWTRDPQYEAMAKFWTKILAVNFAMGVATGIVMQFQFGTNWASYARYVGDVFGSALAAEGIFAFFLESGFLAVLVFGWDRVSPRMHFLATLMVALGSIFSAVWIVVANSWQQTPAGHVIRNGRAEIVDFWAMFFNPSSMVRLAHVLVGSFILGAFFVMGVAAFYILKGRHLDFAKKTFTLGLIVGAAGAILAVVTGHFQGKVVAAMQPAKEAAQEGHFKSGPADLYLFGIPDEKNERVNYGLAIPGGASFLLHEDPSHPVTGLDQFRPEDRPGVVIPFIAFHLMVALGGLFILLTLVGLFLRWRGTLFGKRWLMWLFVFAAFGPYFSNQAGWVAAETGRQPFVVYPEKWQRNEDGLLTPVEDESSTHLRTAEGVSQKVPAWQVLTSLLLFGCIYALLFAVWFYVLRAKVHHGPEEPQQVEAETPAETKPADLLEAAARLANPSGYSLTLAKDPRLAGPPPEHLRQPEGKG